MNDNQLLTKSELIKQAVYYTPSQSVTVGSGLTSYLTFQGYDGDLYGLNRILIGGASLSSLQVTASILYGKGTVTMFGGNGSSASANPIQANAIQNLFKARSLRGAYPIEEQTELQLAITNTSGASITANFSIVGYSKVQFENQKRSYAAQGLLYPQPYIISCQDAVPAGATDYEIPIILPKQTLRLYRMAMGSDSDANITLSIRQNRTYIKPTVYLSQINDEFTYMDIILPIEINSRLPFRLYVNNLDGVNAHTVSFIAETYIV